MSDSDDRVVDLMAELEKSLQVAKATSVPHDHREYVEGCHRCELTKDELDRLCDGCGAMLSRTQGLHHEECPVDAEE